MITIIMLMFGAALERKTEQNPPPKRPPAQEPEPSTTIPAASFKPASSRSEQFANGNVFPDQWAARHNQEVWGTPPSGMYGTMPPPCCIAPAAIMAGFDVRAPVINERLAMSRIADDVVREMLKTSFAVEL
jgi:hypothetical protein